MRKRNRNGVKLPHTCCGEVFTTSQLWSAHKRRVHGPPGGYPCPHCDLVSTEPGALGRHLETHDPVAQHNRFWSRVDKDGPVPEHAPELGPCWVWTASRNRNGYGNFKWPGTGTGLGGKYASAHVYAYTTLVGSIPDGLTLDHLCRNRPCVNPAHLEPCTQEENFERYLVTREQVRCGVCGFMAFGTVGLSTHARMKHELTLAAVSETATGGDDA